MSQQLKQLLSTFSGWCYKMSLSLNPGIFLTQILGWTWLDFLMTSHPLSCGCSCCHWGWCMDVHSHVNIEVYDMKLFKQNYRFIFPSFTMNMRKHFRLWHSNYPLGRNRPMYVSEECKHLYLHLCIFSSVSTFKKFQFMIL